MQNEEVQSHATHHYLFLPLINTFTLGIYGLVAPEQAASFAQTDGELSQVDSDNFSAESEEKDTTIAATHP